MSNFTIVKEQLPSPWASYLVNGEADALEENEEIAITRTLEHLGLENAHCVDVQDDSSFSLAPSYMPAPEYAGDYSTFIFHKYN